VGASIDIMIPFWGDPDLLMQAVQSVLDQDNPDWRLVVVDDCYPVSVADRIAAIGDDRVSYHRNETNLGITDNYRRCIELSTAPLVVLFGCDDVMEPNYVDVVLATYAAVPDATIIQPGAKVIDSNGDVYWPLRDIVKQKLLAPRSKGITVLRGEQAALSLMRGDWLVWPSLAFQREAIAAQPFRPGLPIIQDLALLIDLVIAGGVLVFNPQVAFNSRRHRGSASALSAVDGRRFAGEGTYLKLATQLLSNRGWHRAAWAARLRILSRLDAVTCLPAAIAARNSVGVRQLLKHIFTVG